MSPKILNDFHYSKYFPVSSLPKMLNVIRWLMEKEEKPEAVSLFDSSKLKKHQLLKSLQRSYNFFGYRIPFMERTLLFFPEYAVLYQRTFQKVMNKEESIPFEWRLYLAILVVPFRVFWLKYHHTVCLFWLNRLLLHSTATICSRFSGPSSSKLEGIKSGLKGARNSPTNSKNSWRLFRFWLTILKTS